jgi:hypothetical protein
MNYLFSSAAILVIDWDGLLRFTDGTKGFSNPAHR